MVEAEAEVNTNAAEESRLRAEESLAKVVEEATVNIADRRIIVEGLSIQAEEAMATSMAAAMVSTEEDANATAAEAARINVEQDTSVVKAVEETRLTAKEEARSNVERQAAAAK